MPNTVTKLQERFQREASGQEKVMPLVYALLSIALGGGLRTGTLTLLVGEPGSSKTFAALAMCLYAYLHGWSWVYLPFERDNEYALRRMLSIFVNDWRVMDVGRKENAHILNDDKVLKHMAKIEPCILPNPRQMRRDDMGNMFVPDCHYADILGHLRKLCQANQFVVLDPLSMLAFDDSGRGAWEGQERFAKDAAALAAQYGTRILIVHHTRKSASGGKPRQNSLDEVAGAAALSRFSDNVIFLEHNSDGTENEIVDPYGITTSKVHKRTLYVAKARDGKGAGWKIACDLSEEGPVLKEWGFVKRKGGK